MTNFKFEMNNYLESRKRQKIICYSYRNESYHLSDFDEYHSYIGMNPFFSFANDLNFMILVLDTESQGMSLPIEKKFEYFGDNIPTESNIKSIIENNQYSVIFKIWLDQNNNFSSELIYQPNF